MSFALLPRGMVLSKLTWVVCASSLAVTLGEVEMTCWSASTLVEWILSSFVLRVMDVVSSATSRLAACQQAHVCLAWGKRGSDVLNYHGAIVGEVAKVWLQRQVVVYGLDIGG